MALRFAALVIAVTAVATIAQTDNLAAAGTSAPTPAPATITTSAPTPPPTPSPTEVALDRYKTGEESASGAMAALEAAVEDIRSMAGNTSRIDAVGSSILESQGENRHDIREAKSHAKDALQTLADAAKRNATDLCSLARAVEAARKAASGNSTKDEAAHKDAPHGWEKYVPERDREYLQRSSCQEGDSGNDMLRHARTLQRHADRYIDTVYDEINDRIKGANKDARRERKEAAHAREAKQMVAAYEKMAKARKTAAAEAAAAAAKAKAAAEAAAAKKQADKEAAAKAAAAAAQAAKEKDDAQALAIKQRAAAEAAKEADSATKSAPAPAAPAPTPSAPAPTPAPAPGWPFLATDPGTRSKPSGAMDMRPIVLVAGFAGLVLLGVGIQWQPRQPAPMLDNFPNLG